MKVIRTIQEWRAVRSADMPASACVGFVPTMGALHAGHASLIETARRECDLVVLSIFVNPTQFNNPDDFAKYPITIEQDLALAKEFGVDYVLLPKSMQELYPDNYRYKVTESEFSRELCGAHRPGHFDGVLSVVMKLFHLVKPTRAYFGEKDFQQLELIRGMVDAFFMDVKIVACPTVRENDGLALSSRNVRLSADARKKSQSFPQALMRAPTAETARAELEELGFAVDYVVDKNNRRFGAIHVDGVRLIDNVERGGER